MSVDSIRGFIRSQILNDTEADIDSDQDLLLSGTLDSLGVVQLIDFLETTYLISIPAQDVTLDNFSTLSLIDAYLRSRTGSTGAPPPG